MKWYKHISDSLDDPFIFDLMEKFGADGYLVFFGTLEIYAREFLPEDGWKLRVTRAYLKQKLCKRQDTLVIKSLKHIQNSGKWEIEITDSEVTIFIPKFTQLLDEWTMRKLGSKSGVAPKILKTDKDKEKDTDKTPTPLKRGNSYSDDFVAFCTAYPKKSGSKKAAWENWKKQNGDRPDIEIILSAITAQIEWRKNSGGEFRPEWKDPERWIKGKMWEADLTPIKTKPSPFDGAL